MDYFKIICIPARDYSWNNWIGTVNDKPISVVQGGSSDYDWNNNRIIINVPQTIFAELEDGPEKDQIKENGFKIIVNDTEATQYWGRDIDKPITIEFKVSKESFMRIFHFVDYKRKGLK